MKVNGQTAIYLLVILGVGSLLTAAFLLINPRTATSDAIGADSTEPIAVVPVETAVSPKAPPPATPSQSTFSVTLYYGDEQQVIATTAETVADLLAEVDIPTFATDQIEPGLQAPLHPNMTIRISPSQPVSIEVDGRLIQTRTAYSTVSQILNEAGIGLIGFDYTVPPLSATIQTGETIQVIRVTEDYRVEEETIPYQTIWQASADLPLDTQSLITAGVPGIIKRRYRIRYENGVQVSETADGDWISQEPINQVIGYGTKITVNSINTPNGPLEYWRVVRMRVTSYTAASSGKEPGDPGYGITASGLPAGYGIVAIDRNLVPFLSEVYVPGYGIGLAGDTGGGVRGRWIDLGYEEENYVSWSGYVDVYYLLPIPAPEDINYILPAGLP